MSKLIQSLILLLMICIPAMAQNTPKAEVFGGYSFVPDVAADQILHGWNASLNGSINDWLGIKGDLSGHYARRGGLKVNLHILSVGPQLSYRRNDKVVPFVHVLLGGGWASAGFGNLNFSNAAFAMNIGGGLDWIIHKRCAIRAIQLDLLVTHFGLDTSTDPRISAGVVFRFGSK